MIKFGTLSSGAAFFTTAALVTFGMEYIVLIPLLVYLVPAISAYSKTPSNIWRSFTVISFSAAILITLFVTFLSPNDIQTNGAERASALLVNSVFVFGLVLFPLNLLSTIDTIRKRNPRPRSAT